jgi:hypothetical protein
MQEMTLEEIENVSGGAFMSSIAAAVEKALSSMVSSTVAQVSSTSIADAVIAFQSLARGIEAGITAGSLLSSPSAPIPSTSGLDSMLAKLGLSMPSIP